MKAINHARTAFQPTSLEWLLSMLHRECPQNMYANPIIFVLSEFGICTLRAYSIMLRSRTLWIPILPCIPASQAVPNRLRTFPKSKRKRVGSSNPWFLPMNSVVPNTSVIATKHWYWMFDPTWRCCYWCGFKIHTFNETCISPRDSIELLLAADLTPYLAPWRSDPM